MSLSAIALTILPAFLYIAVGYVIVAARILSSEVGDALAAFVFNIAVPLLLVRALATMALPEVSPLSFWGVYLAAVVLNIALGMVLTERVFGRDARAGVIGGMSASFSNLVMVGVPILTLAFGEEGQVAGFLLIAAHLPFMMAASALLIEVAEARGGGPSGGFAASLRRVALSLVRNPFIIGIVAGVTLRVANVPLTGVARTVLDGLADTTIPLALVSLGMSLHRFGVRGNVAPAVVLGSLKLFAMPAVVYVLAVHVAALPALPAAVLVVAAACPTGVNAYLIASRFETGLALSANTITLTTVVSIATFAMWIALVAG